MAGEKPVLSKSTFLRALQCHKSLYFYKNHIYLRNKISTEQQARFNRGNKVGVAAQNIFPGGKNGSLGYERKNTEAAALTAQLIEKGEIIIYEAAFISNRMFAAIDILIKENDKWYGFEVKSSARVLYNHIQDASFQYKVIKDSGIILEDFFIVHLDTSYIKNGSLEYDKLFKKASVLDQVLKNQSVIEENIELALEMLKKNITPDVPIGVHCFEPYSCDFSGQCWGEQPGNSVFSLGGMHKKDQFEMYDKGFKTLNDIPDEYPLRKAQSMQIDALKNNMPIVEQDKLNDFISSIRYPIYFMDFESMMPAIPIFDGTTPFHHLPFQFSIHYLVDIKSEAAHFSFLAEQGKDPRKEFIEALLKVIGSEGTILVYNMDAERKSLNDLKNIFPQYKTEIENIISRMSDLAQPFLNYWYYHPAMKGSTSMKNVLPALVPELNYDDLKINNGNLASIAFEALQYENDMFKILEVREQLLKYCEMDTYGMVRIWEKLNEIAVR